MLRFPEARFRGAVATATVGAFDAPSNGTHLSFPNTKKSSADFWWEKNTKLRNLQARVQMGDSILKRMLTRKRLFEKRTCPKLQTYRRVVVDKLKSRSTDADVRRSVCTCSSYAYHTRSIMNLRICATLDYKRFSSLAHTYKLVLPRQRKIPSLAALFGR